MLNTLDADQNQIDAAALIDAAPFGSLQRMVILLCFLVYLLDGYDTLAIGYTAPLLADVVHMKLSQLGTVFSTGILGAAIGTFSFGILGDRIGRRWSLIGACAIFAVFSLLTVAVTTLPSLLMARFLTGLGLGGATPLFIALATEYAPKRHRALAMSVVYAAFPLGGVLAGLVSSWLVPLYGWQAVFLVGGFCPLVICAMLVRSLPESIRFLLAQGNRPEGNHQHAAARILARMGLPGIRPNVTIVTDDPGRPRHVAMAQLFMELDLARSILLWLMYFAVFMVIMTLSAWTPSLLRNAGFSFGTAALILAANSFGSVVGTLGAGYLFDRFGVGRVLMPLLLLSAVFVSQYGPASHSPLLLGIVATLAGVFVTASSTCLFALSGTVYSTPVRATGTGVALGFGRIGQLLGPIGIGLLLGQQLGLGSIFLIAMLPCLAAALAAAAFTLPRRGSSPARFALKRGPTQP